MTKTAVIFPGQGAQSVGMGKDIFQASKRARQIYDQAGEVLGIDIADLCFNGPARHLERTDVQQPAIFVTSVATWEAMLEAGVDRERFTHAGGLSLGEYSALYAAGAIDFREALEVVRRRGELMQAAALASPSGMVSLVGADDETAHRVCKEAAQDEILAPANFNCPGQIVIAGTKHACERAVIVAEAQGIRAIVLPVAGAFHSSLMESAAIGLAAVLDDATFHPCGMSVVSNVNASYHGDAKDMRAILCKQVTQPVMWQQCVERMIADGVREFIEMGPGRVLTGLMRKINRKQPITNVSKAASLSAVLDAAAAS